MNKKSRTEQILADLQQEVDAAFHLVIEAIGHCGLTEEQLFKIEETILMRRKLQMAEFRKQQANMR